MTDTITLNAVYTGSKSITLRGHAYEMRGMQGYAYREGSDSSEIFIFQPDVQPDPESKEELLVWHKAKNHQQLSPTEKQVYKSLLDTIRFRVSPDDLTFTQ
jgi:hypothetical protein